LRINGRLVVVVVVSWINGADQGFHLLGMATLLREKTKCGYEAA
jgi:hypothetical protein